MGELQHSTNYRLEALHGLKLHVADCTGYDAGYGYVYDNNQGGNNQGGNNQGGNNQGGNNPSGQTPLEYVKDIADSEPLDISDPDG